MRVSPSSQAGRILALLEQGGWWTTSELLRHVPSIVHSRVADLRAKGYVIEHRTTGLGAQHSLYRLGVAPTAGGTPEPSPAVGGAHGNAPAGPSPHSEGAPPQSVPSEVQMALELPARLREVA